MKYGILLACLIALAMIIPSACKKIEVPDGTPRCVKQKIRKLQREECPSVGTVYSYDFQGSKIYVFAPKLCAGDLEWEVVNEDCQHVCWLWGFSGNPICNGSDIRAETTNEKIIWEEE